MSHIYTEVFNYGLALIGLYMHIYMYIWTYLLSGSFDTEVYIWVYIYMEVFSLQRRAQIFILCIYTCGVGLKWNSCVGTLIAKHVA